MHSRPPPSLFHDSIAQGCRSNSVNRIRHCSRESLSQFRANTVISRPRFFQFHISFGQPDNGQLHCFLSRPVLTCSHGITSEGLRSYLAVR